MAARWFYGWNVVAAVFVMAMLSFGLGFYGVTVYVATLQRLHGWSAAAVLAPITAYYFGGALVTALIGGQQPGLGSATSDRGRSGSVIRPLRDASST